MRRVGHDYSFCLVACWSNHNTRRKLGERTGVPAYPNQPRRPQAPPDQELKQDHAGAMPKGRAGGFTKRRAVEGAQALHRMFSSRPDGTSSWAGGNHDWSQNRTKRASPCVSILEFPTPGSGNQDFGGFGPKSINTPSARAVKL